MPYFERVDSYDTYNGYDSDFHYDYNANSGGGQAFLVTYNLLRTFTAA